MAAVASKSYLEQMREMAKAARKTEKFKESFDDWKEKKKQSDILKYFETHVMKDAKEKIAERAAQGCFSAHLTQYNFGDFFFINKKGEVEIMKEFREDTGYYLHRVHFAVKSEFFQTKLREFVKYLDEKMQYDCWYPGRDKVNVITVFWGPTKSHKWEGVWDDDSEVSYDSDNKSDTKDDSDIEAPATPMPGDEVSVEMLSLDKKKETYASKTKEGKNKAVEK